MSLLQKASIITTPTAYAEDYLYSIKPAYALGSELVTNGDFSDGLTGWTSYNAVVSVTQKQLKIDDSANAGANSSAITSVTLSQGKKYIFSVRLISTTTSLYVSAASTTNTVAPSNGFTLQNITEAGVHNFTFTADANGLRYFWINTGGVGITIVDDVSVKEVTDADFDFDRNSTGTRVNEDYLIEDVPYNFIPYSQDFSNSNWRKRTSDSTQVPVITDNYALAPDGTLTASRVVVTKPNTENDFAVIDNFQSVSKSVGSKFANSVFLKASDSSQVGKIVNVYSYDADYMSFVTHTLTDYWVRITAVATATSTTGNTETIVIGKARSSGGGTSLANMSTDFLVWGAQFVKGDQPKDYLQTTDRLDIPRIDYTNGEPSILLEPSRTNLITYSNDFTNAAWDKDNSTITANNTTSPEGLTNASKLTEDTATSSHRVEETVTVSNGATVTCSVYAKKGERNFILLFESNSADGAYFNLDTGKFVRVDGTPVDYNIQDLKNGWYRCSIVVTVPSTSCRFQIYMTQTSNTSSYTGDGSSSMFIYGAQVEVGSYATSLIHTSGSTVTRSADFADNAGNSDLINSTEGVFYLQFAALTGAGAFDDLSLSDGTQNNKVQLFYRATDKINVRVTVGGVNVFDHQYQSIDMTQFEKVAVKWKLNDFSMYVDGREVDSDSSGATFPANTLNEVKINDNNISDYEGKIKCLAVFKEALTDLELEKLTGYNNHELYMNYYNRLSYLGLAEEYNVESDINNYIL